MLVLLLFGVRFPALAQSVLTLPGSYPSHGCPPDFSRAYCSSAKRLWAPPGAGSGSAPHTAASPAASGSAPVLSDTLAPHTTPAPGTDTAESRGTLWPPQRAALLWAVPAAPPDSLGRPPGAARALYCRSASGCGRRSALPTGRQAQGDLAMTGCRMCSLGAEVEGSLAAANW